METVNLKGKKLRLTKLSDDKFEGNHPNGIVEGTVREGIAFSDLEVGRIFILEKVSIKFGRPYFHTSTVVSIDDCACEFKTLNSTYKVEYL